jgi:hypothetical protein
MHENIGVFGVVRPAVAEEERASARLRTAGNEEGVVLAGRGVRVDRDGVRRDGARAAIAERLHPLLVPVDVKVGVDVFEAVLRAVEGEVAFRWGDERELAVDEVGPRAVQRLVGELDVFVGGLRDDGAVVRVLQLGGVQGDDGVGIEDSGRFGVVEEGSSADQRAGGGVVVVLIGSERGLMDDASLDSSALRDPWPLTGGAG